MKFASVLSEIDRELAERGVPSLSETPDFVIGYMVELATTRERRVALLYLLAHRHDNTRPDLQPTGDPEKDLTQLVTLIENIRKARPSWAGTSGLSDVIVFARNLRQSWKREE